MAPQVNHDPPTPLRLRSAAMDDEAPPPIRLDDLDSPRFSAEAAAVMAAGAAAGHRRRADPRSACASDALDRAGGATDFGPDGWQEPLEVLCDSLRTEAGLSAFGTVSMHAQLVQLLANRLLVEAYLRAHPDALDAPVARPIVVAGLPRTGTTHLHNLLSADPALRSLPYWEAVEPLPAPGEAGGLDRSPHRTLRVRPGHGAAVDARDAAHARDDPVAHPRGDPPAGHGLLHAAVRHARPDAHLAGPLPIGGPDTALRVPVPGAAGAPARPRRRSLGAQEPPAPGAVRTVVDGVPRRDVRADPPGPGRRHRVDGDHARLRRPHAPGAARSAGHQRVLAAAAHGPAHLVRARP